MNTLANTYEILKATNLRSVRAAIRRNDYLGHTAGLAEGHLQANLVILPEKYALDFMRYCQRNPKPCPLTGVSDTGNPMMYTMGRDIDIRTDVSAYNIYEQGALSHSVDDITSLWREDLVVFALGCSFTFEHALQKAGISLWHIVKNKTVSMFRTNIKTVSAGRFSGEMVVTMRAIPQDRVEQVKNISSRFPFAHGAPLHVGDPSHIGIQNLSMPDWGDAAPIGAGDIPVFWACGVTPQVAIKQAKLPFCITHKPGHMLITDVTEEADTPIFQSN